MQKNDAKSTITEAEGNDNWLIAIPEYEPEEIKGNVRATELFLLRANPLIGIQVKRLLDLKKYDREWSEVIVKGGMIAHQGLVLDAEKEWGAILGPATIVAKVHDYATPEIFSVMYSKDATRMTCTCNDWRQTNSGYHDDMKEFIVLPLEGDKIYCKHIIATLLMFNTPYKLLKESPIAEMTATIATVKLRNQYITILGNEIPEWVKKMRPVTFEREDTLVIGVPESMFEAVEGDENREAINEVFSKAYPHLKLFVRPESVPDSEPAEEKQPVLTNDSAQDATDKLSALLEQEKGLLTKKLKQRFKDVGSQESIKDPIIIAKFFNPAGAGTWYATEYDPESRTFFGYVSIFGDHNDELGYFALDELNEYRGQWGTKIERDLHFGEKQLSEVTN